MNIDDAVQALWSSTQAGGPFPEGLKSGLTLAEALSIQLAMLERRKAAGEKQAGWKVGLTSPAVRAKYGSEERPFGHIMAHRVLDAGASVPVGEIPQCGVEAELCFTMGETLRGPGVDAARAWGAVAAVSPAFEVLEKRGGGGAGFTLAVADNLSHWGIVVGGAVAPVPEGAALAEVTMQMRRNGEPQANVVGAEVIDDHFLSLSLLANRLAEHGLALEEGQRVITGSYTKHDPAAGEQWEAEFSGIGKVSVAFG